MLLNILDGAKMPILVLWILIGILSTAFSADTAIVEHGLVSKHTTGLQKFNVSDLLFNNGAEGVAVWEKVVNVLEQWSESPSCNIDAASRLFIACSELKDDFENADDQINAAKSLFAIRMAICETAEGGAKVPSSCTQVAKHADPKVQKKIIFDDDLHLIRSGSLPSCIRSLQKEHYYWTSYSNHRQEAGNVCSAINPSVEQRKVLMIYRDTMEGLVGIMQLVEKHRNAADDWFRATEIHSRNLSSKFHEEMQYWEQHRKDQAARFLEAFEAIELAASAANQKVARATHDFSDSITDLHSSVVGLTSSIPTLHQALARSVAHTSQEIMDITNSQKHELSVVMSTILNLHELIQSGQFPQGLKEHLQDAQNSVVALIELQRSQSILIENTASALEEQLSRQHESRSVTDDVLAKMYAISSNVDHIAGPVKLLGNLFEAFEEGKWMVGKIDVAVFGLFTTASTILLLVPGNRVWGAYLYLSYWFSISLRICVNQIDIGATIKTAMTAIDDAFNTSNVFAILTMLIVIGVIVRTAVSLTKQQSLRKMVQYTPALKNSAFEYQPVRRQAIYSETTRNARAGTAPPGL